MPSDDLPKKHIESLYLPPSLAQNQAWFSLLKEKGLVPSEQVLDRLPSDVCLGMIEHQDLRVPVGVQYNEDVGATEVYMLLVEVPKLIGLVLHIRGMLIAHGARPATDDLLRFAEMLERSAEGGRD